MNNNFNATCNISELFKKTVLKTEPDFIDQSSILNHGISSAGGLGFTAGSGIRPKSVTLTSPILDSDNHIIATAHQQQIHQQQLQLIGSTLSVKVTINNCKKSYLYILVNIAFINISNCHDCIIVLGPCTEYIDIVDSSKITLIAITKSLKIRSSSAISLNLCCNQRPMVTFDCVDVRFAPYNTHYQTLENHLLHSKLLTSMQNNQWNLPQIVDQNGQNVSLDQQQQQTIFKISEPEEFCPFTIPFLIKGKTKVNPIELPPKYKQALIDKQNAVHNLHKLIQSATQDSKTKSNLLHLIESKFQDWLVETDNIRQINDLINLKR
ncbi:hypothetical protein DLAC_11609 [Tieghemostelium lacteum]|uniref:C-CAP/cofactor C-like domain-containing protein n=1 Tax=Tieghemostelium lacteum TaxID=361077 RepID=A0A151ZI45_TIELA|nr:hypothetical protein DLAC_11609 [Tieghemostelium lacteum]|eukprot:KYQ93671.1 hypothetical protein DLAC_11609 [Tieghemostelium lacteum]